MPSVANSLALFFFSEKVNFDNKITLIAITQIQQIHPTGSAFEHTPTVGIDF